MSVYIDSNGNYWEPGSLVAGDASQQLVNQRQPNCGGFQTVPMAVAAVQSCLLSGAWSLAPGVTDLGGAVWSAGRYVDPGEVAS